MGSRACSPSSTRTGTGADVRGIPFAAALGALLTGGREVDGQAFTPMDVLGNLFRARVESGDSHRRKRWNRHRTRHVALFADRKQRLKPASGPGSMDCEVEIRRLIERGQRAAALKLYEDDRDICGRGNKRLGRWYALAKAGDPRAA